MKRAGLVTFSIALSLVNDEPPKEIRIFKAGINDSRKGPALFDDEAARLVMAAYKQHGADLMFDLEHLSLDDTAPNYDPDARGWSNLELRAAKKPVPGAQYDLFGTAVRWTEDGDQRLRKKTQRYISPAFVVDTKSRRVVELVNVAITALPATDKLTPLVAARRNGLEKRMKTNPKLLAALGLEPDADEKAVADAMAEAMKDPAQLAALMSAVLDADDGGDAGATVAAKDEPGANDKTAVALKKASRSSALEDDLATELVALRREVDEGKTLSLIAANRNKIGTPALEKWALKQSPAALSEWLNAAPVVAAPVKVGEKKNEGAKTEEVQLSRADLALIKQSGADPVAYLKHKRELATARAERLAAHTEEV